MKPPPSDTASSADLGSTLRRVLVTPGDGFGAVLARARRRSRRRGGRLPYVLGAGGGLALMMLWLKIGGLAGGREASPSSFGWGEVSTALLAGAVITLCAQVLFGALGPIAMRAMNANVTGGELRLVWGTAAFPQVLVVVFIFPIDLLIVGPQIFATTRLHDSVSTVWAALSIALCSACAAWSLTLFVRGVQVAAGLSLPKALATTLFALGCLVLIVVAASLLLVGVWG